MQDFPTISEAESVVMEVLWRTSPIPTEDVVAALKNRQNWQEPTIKTLLSRLLKKGAVSAERDGRRYLYSPVLQREQWLSSEGLESTQSGPSIDRLNPSSHPFQRSSSDLVSIT